MRKDSVFPEKLSRLDYYRITISILMTILGGIILLRALTSGIYTFLTFLVSGGFLSLGIYRLSFVYKYFKRRKNVAS